MTKPSDRDGVSIVTLGAFHVFRADRPISASAWQSKKSRVLLKILVARRGRPAHRELLSEILWPDQSAGETGARFSVVLSKLRSLLDPERRFGKDHHIADCDEAIALNTANVDVDVERFLAVGRDGLAALAAGECSQAIATLTTAHDLYGGDFLEADLYEDWAAPLRERARAVYLSITRRLGELAARRNEYRTAVGYFTGILDLDPYAEDAHLGLVAAALGSGRHGEARRHYQAYVTRMNDLEIPAVPFPASQSLSLSKGP